MSTAVCPKDFHAESRDENNSASDCQETTTSLSRSASDSNPEPFLPVNGKILLNLIEGEDQKDRVKEGWFIV